MAEKPASPGKPPEVRRPKPVKKTQPVTQSPKPPAKPKVKKASGGTPRKPKAVPNVTGLSGVVKYPYKKLADPTHPTFPIYGDPAKFMDPFTKDEFMALAEELDKEEGAGNAGCVEEARPTPTKIQEIYRDVHRRTAGTLVGDVMHHKTVSGFLPNIVRYQIPDPDAPEDGQNTATLVQVYCPPGEHIHQLWPPDALEGTVWTHTWRAMLPHGMIKYTGGKLPAGNQRAGLAAAILDTSTTRELVSNPDHVTQLLKLWAAHQANGLG